MEANIHMDWIGVTGWRAIIWAIQDKTRKKDEVSKVGDKISHRGLSTFKFQCAARWDT